MGEQARPAQNFARQNQKAADQLLLTLFEGNANPLSQPFGLWLAKSKLFAHFALKYQSKIRKKIRLCRNAHETFDLYCELRTAYLLLQEPAFAVEYEPYATREGRSADFAVTFRTAHTFDVEVTRLRTSQQEQRLNERKEIDLASDWDEQIRLVRRHESRRLTDVVCEKFGQFSPNRPNVLWVWGESRVMPEVDLGLVMVDLRRRAEERDTALFARHGFEKPADVIRHFQRLSAIVVCCLHEQAMDRQLWWHNSDSRFPLPAKVANRLRSLNTTAGAFDFAPLLNEE